MSLELTPQLEDCAMLVIKYIKLIKTSPLFVMNKLLHLWTKINKTGLQSVSMTFGTCLLLWRVGRRCKAPLVPRLWRQTNLQLLYSCYVSTLCKVLLITLPHIIIKVSGFRYKMKYIMLYSILLFWNIPFLVTKLRP